MDRKKSTEKSCIIKGENKNEQKENDYSDGNDCSRPDG